MTMDGMFDIDENGGGGGFAPHRPRPADRPARPVGEQVEHDPAGNTRFVGAPGIGSGFGGRRPDRPQERQDRAERPQERQDGRSPFDRPVQPAQPAQPAERVQERPADRGFRADRGDRGRSVEGGGDRGRPVESDADRGRPVGVNNRDTRQGRSSGQPTAGSRPPARLGQEEIATYRSMREAGYLNRESLVRYRRQFTQAFAVLFTINSFIGMVYVCASVQAAVRGESDWIAVVLGIIISIVLFLGQCVYADYDTAWDRVGYYSLLVPDMATTMVFWHSAVLVPTIVALSSGVEGIDAPLLATVLSLPVAALIGYVSSRFPEHAFFGKRIRGYLKRRSVSA